MRKLVHELEVHQIELEMQNEELRAAQCEKQETLETFAELFDFAPIAYFVLDKDGIVRKLNLAAGKLFRLDRNKVMNQRFNQYVAPPCLPEFRAFRRAMLPSYPKRTCELTLLKPGQATCDVLIEGVLAEGAPRRGRRRPPRRD